MSCWSPGSFPPSYLQWSSLTHLAVGLRCALPNDELCIDRCHFEKCNYLSDKADGPVLSGICCASIKSLVPEKELLTHKHWRVIRFPYASMNKHTHLNRYTNTYTSSLDIWTLLRRMTFSKSVKQKQQLNLNVLLLFGDLSHWYVCSVEGQYLQFDCAIQLEFTTISYSAWKQYLIRNLVVRLKFAMHTALNTGLVTRARLVQLIGNTNYAWDWSIYVSNKEWFLKKEREWNY